MHSVLFFKNLTFYNDGREPTIAGKKFQALMDLCFAHADTFSLHRCSWPGAHNGALEEALRPYLLGEYFSYGTLIEFDRESREKCYLYPATRETREVLLQHIHHLFDREESLAPAGHEEYLRQKYAVYHRAWEEANSRFIRYMDTEGRRQSKEQRDAAWKHIYREAKARFLEVFSEADYYSSMEDPCFFRGTELFFETVTHEQECFACVLSPEFEESLHKLGEWVDISEESRLPLFSLDTAEGWKRLYAASDGTACNFSAGAPGSGV